MRQTVVTCSIVALVVAAIASITGHVGVGLGLAAGLMLGSVNGYLIQGLLVRGAPFVAASLMRILVFSSIVLLAALTLRSAACLWNRSGSALTYGAAWPILLHSVAEE